MTIRKISADLSRSKADMSPITPENGALRRNVGLKIKAEIDMAEECSIFMDLKRRKREIVAWSCLNLLLIFLVLTDFLHGTMPLSLLRVLQGVTVVVCVCNVLYYLLAFLDVRRRADMQKMRLKVGAQQTSPPASKKKMEFVRYRPLDAESNPSYWKDFQSIFESFKRMTARNRIAFFANDTLRGGLEPVESPPPSTSSDVKHVLSDTLTKYKGQIITSARDLKHYLTDHRIATENEFVKTSEDSNMYLESSDFWSSRRRNMSDNCMDVSPLLRRSEYQNSPSSSDSSVCSSKESGCTNREFFALLWDSYKIESSAFIYWISNFRMWLSKTVLSRVVSEMAVVDNGLRTLRLSGLSIGNVSLETLEDAYRNPQVAHQLPSLSYVLPFLRVSTKQNYVVARYRTLAQGHGMCDFRWNSGGDVGSKPWETGYPTDAELLMHLFATYLDQQLPLSPSTFPHSDTSKPFSSYYLADSVKSAKQNRICLIRQSLNPPHFDLLVDGELQELPPGRNNLFYAIVLFLYCVKVHEHGMLGRISLGKHGIDMLWIIDEKGI